MSIVVQSHDPALLGYTLRAVHQMDALAEVIAAQALQCRSGGSELVAIEAMAVRLRSLAGLCMSALEDPEVDLQRLHQALHGTPLAMGNLLQGANA